MTESKPNGIRMSKDSLQLLRLERLTDVVFALVIIRLFILLPKPESMDNIFTSIGDLLLANAMDLK